MKRLINTSLIAFIALCASVSGFAQTIVQFATPTSTNYAPSTSPPTGVTSTNLTAPGISSISTSGACTPSSGNANTRCNVSSTWSTATGSSATTYLTFTLTVAAGYQMTVSSISLDHRRTTAGPTSYQIDYTANGTTVAGSSGSVSTTCATGVSISPNVTVSSGNTLVVKILYWATSASGNLDFRNVTVSGTVATASAPTITSLGSSSGCEGSNIVINGTNLSGATAANVKIGGTPVSSIVSNTGSVLTAVVGSGTTGTVAVTIGSNTAISSSSFTVNPAPADPGNPSSNSPQCDPPGVSLSFNGSAPTGENWYWQSAASGTSTSNSNSSYTVNTTGTVYVRSQNATTGCWSLGAGSAAVVVNPAPTTAAAGSNQTICSNAAATLAANTPTTGTGAWSVVSGPTTASSQFSSTSNPAAVFTPSGGAGTYVLQWTISNGVCTPSVSTVTITVNAAPATPGTISASTPACLNTDLSYSAASVPVDVSWFWQTSASGQATSNAANPYNVSSTGTYYLRAQNTVNGCWSTSSNSKAVVIDQLPTAASAGATKSTCINTAVAMTANAASTGTGAWSIVSGPSTSTSQFSSLSNATANFTPTAAGSYTLRWTISNGSCTASTSDVSVTSSATPTTANAGSGQTMCTAQGSVTLAANTPTAGTGTWSVSSGPSTLSTQFANVNSPTSIFTPAGGAGTYVLSWTIANPPCTQSSSSVTITVKQSPAVTASNNGPVCQGAALSLTGSPSGLTSYAWSGPNSFSVPAATQPYTQNFDGLPSSSGTWVDNSTLPGWYIAQDGSASPLYKGAGDGSLSTGGVWSYGTTTSSSDRSLGSLSSGTPLNIYLGLKITNTTGAPVYTILVNYNGEKYRTGAASGEGYDFSYQIGATSLTSGTWTNVSALSYSSPTSGSLPAQSSISGQINLSTPVANGQTIWFRWYDASNSSSNYGIGIDDVDITLVTPGTQSPSVSSSAATAMAGVYTLTGTAANGCAATATTTAVVTTAANASASPTSSKTALSASCDEGTWTYYKSSGGSEYYFGIEWGSSSGNLTAKASATVDLNVLSAPRVAHTSNGNNARFSMRSEWNVNNASAMDAPVKVRFFYDPADKQAVLDSASNYAALHPGSVVSTPSWFKISGAAYDGSQLTETGITNSIVLDSSYGTLNGASYVESNVSSFSGGSYYSAVAPAIALSIKLASFKGYKEAEGNRLEWITSSEKDSHGFEVQRSEDGSSFEKIAFIASQNVGNQAARYIYLDKVPSGSVQYYRLRQLDIDGKYSFSNTIAISRDGGSGINMLSLQPNPAKDQIELNLNATHPVASAEAVVTDLLGRSVQQVQFALGAGNNRISIPLAGLPAGQYFVKVLCGKDCPAVVSKFVKQ